ncbi:MAG: universal stress protein [Hyphomicrobiaceae bacterium]
MSYKTILAYLPNDKAIDRVLDVALPIAQDNDAHLIGLHVRPRVPVLLGVVAAEVPQSILTHQEEMLTRAAEQLGDRFDTRCAKAGVKSEWRCNKVQHNDVASDVIGQSLCADLIVVAQEDEDGYESPADLPSRIVMETARPALIVPHAGKFSSVGKHVVVAWNGSREAARAAFDAVPFMKSAKSVRVLAIDPKSREDYDNIALGDEIALCLARHDIKTEVTVTHSGDITVGDELLNRLADEGCDLLVMGCYGHSRLRETLFGGVTKNLLQRMTAPVLMSH